MPCSSCNQSTPTPSYTYDCNPVPQTTCQGCVETHDASCVKYMLGNLNGYSQLTGLNLPAGTTLQQFMEAVDFAIRDLRSQISNL